MNGPVTTGSYFHRVGGKPLTCFPLLPHELHSVSPHRSLKRGRIVSFTEQKHQRSLIISDNMVAEYILIFTLTIGVKHSNKTKCPPATGYTRGSPFLQVKHPTVSHSYDIESNKS